MPAVPVKSSREPAHAVALSIAFAAIVLTLAAGPTSAASSGNPERGGSEIDLEALVESPCGPMRATSSGSPERGGSEVDLDARLEPLCAAELGSTSGNPERGGSDIDLDASSAPRRSFWTSLWKRFVGLGSRGF